MKDKPESVRIAEKKIEILKEQGYTAEKLKQLSTSEELSEEERSNAKITLESYELLDEYYRLNQVLEQKKAEEIRLKKEILARSGKVGRNDPCPCMSGKKYKSCCMKLLS